MKIQTSSIPIIEASLPAAIDSAPNPGPTDLSSRIFNGAGKAPALKINDYSLVSSTEKFPVI